MDQEHGAGAPSGGFEAKAAAEPHPSLPQDDDERFIIGLVLTYYRRHPQKARTRLLDLLGEVLTPPADPSPASGPRKPAGPIGSTAKPVPIAGTPASSESGAWEQIAKGVAPLKPKKR
jgi:hypothetical protein